MPLSLYEALNRTRLWRNASAHIGHAQLPSPEIMVRDFKIIKSEFDKMRSSCGQPTASQPLGMTPPGPLQQQARAQREVGTMQPPPSRFRASAPAPRSGPAGLRDVP